MFWSFLILVLAIGSVIILQLWWRRKFARAEQAMSEQIQGLVQVQRETVAQLQTQQDTLLNSMAEGLLLLDKSGRIQLANRAFTSLFGVQADLRARTIIEALRLPELADLVGVLGTENQVLGFELRLPAPNERWLEVNGAAILNGGGSRHGSILVFHDLTRLKQLESTRKDFVANVSHELRTPLSLIKGYVETLLEGAKDDPEVSEKFLRTIDRNAERLKLLIEDLLSISELESGRVKLNLQSVELGPVMEKVFADSSDRVGAKSVTLSNQTQDIRVQADPDRLEQVLSNLVENAIKYGRSGGRVNVVARNAENGQVEVCVQDDGPGIPPDSLERVFERFYRVDKARSREQGGTGLGLAIVKHIVQSHRGRVWARSELGHGSAFYFTLPRG
jgi:two-component system phosphate regulon sensor histidine kinase PhoR